MSNDTASFVGDIPKHYDRGLGPILFADYAADIAQRVAALRPARLLEIAAGTGIVSRELRRLLPATITQLVATDLNAQMLDEARTKLQPADRVELQIADAAALPFADASFDAVVCQFGVMFFPEKGRSYREVHRVLAPGGRYIFNVWDSSRYNPFAQIAHDVIGSFFPADPPQFYRVPFSYYQIDPIKDSLIEEGFTAIAIEVVRLMREVKDAAAFAQGLVYGNPVIGQIRA